MIMTYSDICCSGTSRAHAAGIPIVGPPSACVATVIAGVIAVCVATVLADGTSVIKLKPVKELPVITAPELKKEGYDYRLDQLLGPTYGIGLHHDQAGMTWWESGAEDSLAYLVKTLGIKQVSAAVPRVIMTDCE